MRVACWAESADRQAALGPASVLRGERRAHDPALQGRPPSRWPRRPSSPSLDASESPLSLLHCHYPLLPLLPIITYYQPGSLQMRMASEFCTPSWLLTAAPPRPAGSGSCAALRGGRARFFSRAVLQRSCPAPVFSVHGDSARAHWHPQAAAVAGMSAAARAGGGVCGGLSWRPSPNHGIITPIHASPLSLFPPGQQDEAGDSAQSRAAAQNHEEERVGQRDPRGAAPST